MVVAPTKQVYDISKFTIEQTGGYVTVYYNGQFWETADSIAEAEEDINEVIS